MAPSALRQLALLAALALPATQPAPALAKPEPPPRAEIATLVAADLVEADLVPPDLVRRLDDLRRGRWARRRRVCR